MYMDKDLSQAIEEKLGSDLSHLRKVISGCRRCPAGGNGIPGKGEPGASIFMLAGKPGPGSSADNPWGAWWDDFQGQAPSELEWKIDDVYLSTALRCPLEKVTPAELRRCAAFLAEELFIVGPHLVVVSGKLATVTLRAALGEEMPGRPKAGDECSLFSMRFLFDLDIARIGKEKDTAKIFWSILKNQAAT
jgi:uracil-DNA glycosylase